MRESHEQELMHPLHACSRSVESCASDESQTRSHDRAAALTQTHRLLGLAYLESAFALLSCILPWIQLEGRAAWAAGGVFRANVVMGVVFSVRCFNDPFGQGSGAGLCTSPQQAWPLSLMCTGSEQVAMVDATRRLATGALSDSLAAFTHKVSTAALVATAVFLLTGFLKVCHLQARANHIGANSNRGGSCGTLAWTVLQLAAALCMWLPFAALTLAVVPSQAALVEDRGPVFTMGSDTGSIWELQLDTLVWREGFICAAVCTSGVAAAGVCDVLLSRCRERSARPRHSGSCSVHWSA